MKIKRTFLSGVAGATLTAVLALSSAIAFAAGNHHGSHGEKSGIGIPGNAADVTRTIEIKMGDNYYEPEELSIKKGETVRFKIVNAGEFVHEFNIGTAAMHAAHQEEMMMMMEHGVLEADKINRDMMKMDMGNGKTMEHNDPNSVLLEPKETAEVIWKFSDDAELEFACNVPGHYASGMMGEVHFE
ncbi:cupredoxin domain-containing protein [Sneathiella sp. HT1-7]|uniref:cupredoxin domain-containing protein n=1 Tax=Sneathiella sp. HT1-7 TaxID=2887192 RepID=UPI001D14890B|nr:cupredoxin domain-containing protein [Sneathiella sp. HT1-7]MCC3306772.1 cupredoxin domain-containing protein [Sneathiella sp. HT1-7]